MENRYGRWLTEPLVTDPRVQVGLERVDQHAAGDPIRPIRRNRFSATPQYHVIPGPAPGIALQSKIALGLLRRGGRLHRCFYLPGLNLRSGRRAPVVELRQPSLRVRVHDVVRLSRLLL